MNGKFIGTYVSQKGNDVFKYSVSGTPEELAKYKALQGKNLRYVDDNEQNAPILFSSRFGGASVNLHTVEKTGRVIIDMSKFKQIKSVVASVGGEFGQAIAAEAARAMLGDLLAKSSTPVQNAVANTTAPTTEAITADEDGVVIEAPAAEHADAEQTDSF